MSGKNTHTKKPASNLGAGAAGASGGTVLVLLAQNLPEKNPFKSWLVISAPSVSLALSVCWVWMKKYGVEYMKRRHIEKQKEILAKAIQNPITSPEHHEALRKKYEQVEMEQVEALQVSNINEHEPHSAS